MRIDVRFKIDHAGNGRLGNHHVVQRFVEAIGRSPRTSSQSSMRRGAMRCSPRRARSSSGKSRSNVMAVRKPRPPRFTATEESHGHRSLAPPTEVSRHRPAQSRAACLQERRAAPDRRPCPGRRQFRDRSGSNLTALEPGDQLRTMVEACGMPGFEMMPTATIFGIVASMCGIKEELPVAFGPEYRTRVISVRKPRLRTATSTRSQAI